jgi:hypothetical protein
VQKVGQFPGKGMVRFLMRAHDWFFNKNVLVTWEVVKENFPNPNKNYLYEI